MAADSETVSDQPGQQPGQCPPNLARAARELCGRCCCWWASPPPSRPASRSCCGRAVPPTACCMPTSPPQDQAQITQALDAAQIPYRLDPGSNAIEVPAERLSEARLKLAGQGLPDNDRLRRRWTKDPGFGVSQFMENARYQHALETELARTIASLRPVDGRAGAPRRAAPVGFRARSAATASASVFVQLKPGRRLEPEQVQAIVNLVASSVPESRSRTRSRWSTSRDTCCPRPTGTMTSPCASSDSTWSQRMEDDYAQRIEALLTPLVGTGRVRAQVVAQTGHWRSAKQATRAIHARQPDRPQRAAVGASSARSARQRRCTGLALSNQPPAGGSLCRSPPVERQCERPPPRAPRAAHRRAARQAAQRRHGHAAPASGQPARGRGRHVGSRATRLSRRDVTKNYEIDRTLAYTRQPAGTVAPADRRGADRRHAPSPARTASRRRCRSARSELAHVTQLVKDAVGFDAVARRQRQCGQRLLRTESAARQQPTAPWRRRRSGRHPSFWTCANSAPGWSSCSCSCCGAAAAGQDSDHSPMRFAPAVSAHGPAGRTPGGRQAGPAWRPEASRRSRSQSHEQQIDPGAHAGEPGPEARRAGRARLGGLDE